MVLITGLILCVTVVFLLSKRDGTVDRIFGCNQSKHEISSEYCTWEFTRYEQSKYEIGWFAIIRGDKVGKNACPILFNDTNLAETLLLQRSTIDLTKGKKLDLKAESFYSKMHYKEVCSGSDTGKVGAQLIEPLFGILRDPCDQFCRQKPCPDMEWTNGQSKQHILTITAAPFVISSKNTNIKDWQYGIAPWHCFSRVSCLAIDATLMDLGASYFNNWGDSGGNSADAGNWFYGQYQKKNVTIKNYFAYEAQTLDLAEVYKQIPDDLIAAYRWNNLPVSVERNNKLNPWSTLKSFRAGGYSKLVVIKLDIDTPSIENPLVDQLSENNGALAKLVSEFFYEHHVNSIPLNGAWITHNSNITPHNSYNMFKQLRDFGVRSHSWP
jgi:hypothetical protein